jgi:hypothetical protein
MADTARNLSWRQGDILSDEAVAICGLESAEGSSEPIYAIVISHDCDLAASEGKEPNAEVITGRRVRKLGGDSFAKTARRLQVEYQSADGPVVLELVATGKVPVPKAKLFTSAPRRDITLDKQGLNILQRWLAARYRRTAFPEAFEARLRSPQKSGKKTFLDRIEGILEAGGDHIRGLLFDLDEGADVERAALNDTYQLGVVVLYNSLRDEPAAAAVASNAAEELERLFAEAFETQAGEWQGICLTYCDPMSDNAITVVQSEMLKEWRLEHMSLKDYPPQSTISR